MAEVQTAPPAQGLEVRAATINERFIAYVFDFAPFCAGYLATAWAVGVHPALRAHIPDPRFALRAWLALYILYQFAGNLVGGTVGKRLMGIYVVTREGEKPGPARALLRALGYVVSTPLFNWGFALALIHPESRAFHDLIAGTVVVEPRGKSKAESALLFLTALILLGAVWGGFLYTNALKPTAEELEGVEKSREGLLVMAQIEEAYKQQHGVYTDSLLELSKASGDQRKFDAAVLDLFDPNRFQLQAGNAGYMISAASRDRRHTRVAVEGPPARLLDQR